MVIKNGILCAKDGEKRADIRVIDGKIDLIAENIEPESGEELFDANGCFVLPGLIDLNCCIREQSRDKHKSLQKLSYQAVEGGITAILLQPSEPVYSEERLDYYLSLTKEADKPRCFIGVSAAHEDKDAPSFKLIMTNIAILFKNGAAAVSLSSDIDSNIIRRVMEYSKMLGLPVFVNCQNSALDGNAVMHEGSYSFKLGLPGFWAASESSEAAKIAELSYGAGAKLALHSISSKESLRAIKENRQQAGLFVGLSVLNLTLTEAACDSFNTFAKNSPPLRGKEDKEALLTALKNGQIDFICSGHTEVKDAAKDVAFEEAEFGIECIDIYLPLLYTTLVATQCISMSELTKLACFAPAKFLGIDGIGELNEGFAADIVIFDAKERNQKNQHKNARYPYHDLELEGVVKATFVGGELKYSDLNSEVLRPHFTTI